MKVLTLRRREMSDQGTFGVMMLDGKVVHTLELPWKDNKSNISCIPAGEYEIVFVYSPAFKRKLYRLLDVKGRSGILVHSANYAGDRSKGFRSDLLGCIALGNGRSVLNGQKAIISSGDAVRRFEKFLGGEKAKLRIVEEFTWKHY